VEKPAIAFLAHANAGESVYKCQAQQFVSLMPADKEIYRTARSVRPCRSSMADLRVVGRATRAACNVQRLTVPGSQILGAVDKFLLRDHSAAAVTGKFTVGEILTQIVALVHFPFPFLTI